MSHKNKRTTVNKPGTVFVGGKTKVRCKALTIHNEQCRHPGTIKGFCTSHFIKHYYK